MAFVTPVVEYWLEREEKEQEKEMFYLTTHSTHFIYGYMEWKEGTVLFNDALNTLLSCCIL